MSLPSPPLLSVRQLKVQHRLRPPHPFAPRPLLRAVDELNFDLRAGETLGVVGESGSGKSTLARAILGVQPVAAGSIRYAGRELVGLAARDWRPLRREIQMVFQDPQGSLDPRLCIRRIVEEPLEFLCPEVDPVTRAARAARMLARVGLGADLLDRCPHQLSGGQCQRVGIARALVVQPRLLVCDEAVSALDVPVQVEVLQLLRGLQDEIGMAMLFITHDLGIVRQLCDRVLVMYFGRTMEQGETRTVFAQPRHPYTKALLASLPGADAASAPRGVRVGSIEPASASDASPADTIATTRRDRAQRNRFLRDGAAPDVTLPLTGCLFTARCPMADEQCPRRVPHTHSLRDGTAVACHYVSDAWVRGRASTMP